MPVIATLIMFQTQSALFWLTAMDFRGTRQGIYAVTVVTWDHISLARLPILVQCLLVLWLCVMASLLSPRFCPAFILSSVPHVTPCQSEHFGPVFWAD
jgi:hypothetical protein